MLKTFFLFLFISFPVLGADLSENEGIYTFQPCDSWTMSTAGNWQCSFLGMWIQVPTLKELEKAHRVIEFQDKKITDLEERVQKLEGLVAANRLQ